MKYFFIFIAMLFGQLAFGQLNGAIPQKVSPDSSKVNKKPKLTTAAAIAKENADKLTKSLKLNEKQNKELYTALFEYETNTSNNHKSKLSNKQKYLNDLELSKIKNKKLKTIMTKEQYKSYIMSFP